MSKKLLINNGGNSVPFDTNLITYLTAKDLSTGDKSWKNRGSDGDYSLLEGNVIVENNYLKTGSNVNTGGGLAFGNLNASEFENGTVFAKLQFNAPLQNLSLFSDCNNQYTGRNLLGIDVRKITNYMGFTHIGIRDLNANISPYTILGTTKLGILVWTKEDTNLNCRLYYDNTWVENTTSMSVTGLNLSPKVMLCKASFNDLVDKIHNTNIYDIMIYNKFLSTTQQQSVVDYLMKE